MSRATECVRTDRRGRFLDGQVVQAPGHDSAYFGREKDCFRRYVPATLCAVSLLALAPTPALAHASERMIVLTLPTGRYILGAAAVVALTALLGALAPRLPRLPHAPPRLPSRTRRTTPASWLAFAAFAALVATGFLGPHDPLANLLPLAVWTLLWVGLALASMPLGDLWRPIDPWTAPVTATRRLLGRTGGIGLARLGHWPAVAGLLAIAWFEIVSLAPDDPPTLARAVLLYWLAIFALAILEGPAWHPPGRSPHRLLPLRLQDRPALVDPRRPAAPSSTPARPARRSSPPRRSRPRPPPSSPSSSPPSPSTACTSASGGSPASASTRWSSPAAPPSPSPTASASSPPGR